MESSEQLLAAQKTFFTAGSTQMPDARLAALYCLNDTIEQSRPLIAALLRGDGLTGEEVETQLDTVRSELAAWQKDLLRLLRFGWKKAEGGKPQPVGVLLVTGAPGASFAKTLGTVAAAIAAGNAVILNLDKVTSATADSIRTILGDTFEENYITVSGAPQAELEELAFDAKFSAADSPSTSLCSREGLRRFSRFDVEKDEG